MKTLAVILLFPVAMLAAPHKVIALDGWHNDEKLPHYRWEATYPGGYSQLGDLLKGMGGELRTIHEPLSAKTLTGADCLIVADPDTPEESDDPKYFTAPENAAVEAWVRAGGRLVLLGNDKGNAEFEHFNELAGRFGLQFIESKHVNAQGVSKLKLKGTAENPVFSGGLEFYAVDVAPLAVKNRTAEILLSDNGEDIMAIVRHGKGLVFALGDPWLYNEYIGRSDNRRIGENLFRYLLWNEVKK
jgi:unsaturated rhamnogalacturonyl hydrolase